MNKLWQGRITDKSSEILDEFNSSIRFDYKLYREDIEASLVHARMLSQQSIISKADLDVIEKGLNQVKQELEEAIAKEDFSFFKFEDIHSFIEFRLTEIIGDAGKKIHTARSRNDQVITALKLWLKKEIKEIQNLVNDFRKVLISRAKEDLEIVIPGYTHLQQAQFISLGHYWLAYEAKLTRDFQRLDDVLSRVDINPLGSGALAGSTFNIDREFTTKELEFKTYTENSLDAVSDRDYVAELEFALSLLMVHLSGLAEEIIIWNSQEFSFIEIPDHLATGSSMMPQKKNPDIAELIRAKTGRVIGTMNALLITLKGLPLAYNKDLQEDKELLFASIDTVQKSLIIFSELIANIKIKKNSIDKILEKSFCAATDIAEYLVKKGLAFRDAYKITGNIVNHCVSKEIYFQDLSHQQWQSFSELLEKDILELIQPVNSVNARNIPGATAFTQVKSAIKLAETRLGNQVI